MRASSVGEELEKTGSDQLAERWIEQVSTVALYLIHIVITKVMRCYPVIEQRTRVRRSMSLEGMEVSGPCAPMLLEITVQGLPGRLRALSVSDSKSVLYDGFVWARRSRNSPKRWFPGRAGEADRRDLHHPARAPHGTLQRRALVLHRPGPPGAVTRR